MKVVIEVSEKDYQNFLLQYDNGILDEKTPSHRAKIAIARGIPLPKGHGRLIDADELLKYIDSMQSWLNENGYRVIRRIILTDYIRGSIPTIIEADKEGADNDQGRSNQGN